MRSGSNLDHIPKPNDPDDPSLGIHDFNPVMHHEVRVAFDRFRREIAHLVCRTRECGWSISEFESLFVERFLVIVYVEKKSGHGAKMHITPSEFLTLM
jgi:hypothetical protein